MQFFSIISATFLLQGRISAGLAVPDAFKRAFYPAAREVNEAAVATTSHFRGPILEEPLEETGSSSSSLSSLSSHGALPESEQARIILGDALIEAQGRDTSQARAVKALEEATARAAQRDPELARVLMEPIARALERDQELAQVLLRASLAEVLATDGQALAERLAEGRALAAAVFEKDPAVTRAIERDPELARKLVAAVVRAVEQDPELELEIEEATARAAQRDPDLAYALDAFAEAAEQGDQALANALEEVAKTTQMGRMIAKYTIVAPDQAEKGVKHAISVDRMRKSSTPNILEIGAEDAQCLICLEKLSLR